MYNVIHDGIVIDTIEEPVYCKCMKGGRILRTDKTSANCIVSSDGSEVYHILGTAAMPEEYKTVELSLSDDELIHEEIIGKSVEIKEQTE